MTHGIDVLRRLESRAFALTRRGALVGSAAALAQFGLGGAAAAQPKGKMVLAWHTNIAPRWLDPQDHDGTASPDNFITAVHDALIKGAHEKLFDKPALAESFVFAEDAKSATFRLRQGIRFHNGEPITPQDVKFTYENYRGAVGVTLQQMTSGIEIVDSRTITFHFKEPFLDFILLFGSGNVCGAGWTVPAKYYQQVGPDGFKRKPIGAGPYKLVNQEAGVKLEFEAFEHYYKPVNIKHFTMVAVPEAATRLAMLERGEADLIYLVPGELIDRVKQNSKLMLAPVLSGSFWLEFPGFQDPSSPFHDKRVRQAISLAVDRQALNTAELAGMGRNSGNWINNDVQYGLEVPAFEHNLEKARQLMREAGRGDGFAVDWLTPIPPYYPRGERLISQLQQIGIRAKLQVLERGVFLKRNQGGREQWPGVQIIFQGARIGGTWSNWYESFFKCGGHNSRDRICVKELDDKYAKYVASHDRTERKRLAEEIQKSILENYYLVPVMRHAFMNAIGPRLEAKKWQDVFPTVTTGYAHPWEELKLKS